MTGTPVLWAELSSRQIAELARNGPRLVILPVGSTEQHSLHLPVDVDARASYEIAIRVSAATGVPVLPPLAYGDSTGHIGFAGTISLRPEVLLEVVSDICRWVHRSGFSRILLLNGHSSNLPILQTVVSRFMAEIPDLRIRALSYWDVSPRVRALMFPEDPNGVAHAGTGETAVYLALRPDLVDMTRAVDERIDGRVAGGATFFAYRLGERGRYGGTGNPLPATSALGQEILDLVVAELAAQVRAALAEEPPIRAAMPSG